MPRRPLRPCATPACPMLTDEAYCPQHRQRGTAQRPSPSTRGYDAHWRRYRLSFLAAHPLCAECLRQGRTTPAVQVDHIVPHKGDRALFSDPTNHQALCAPCGGRKSAVERGGRAYVIHHTPRGEKISSVEDPRY